MLQKVLILSFDGKHFMGLCFETVIAAVPDEDVIFLIGIPAQEAGMQ
jgi:hypothetical protein